MAIKIAIIEDDQWIRENLTSQIKRTPGYQCIAAFADGEDALQKLPKNIPDVVLMDINLPNMTGIDGTAQLNAITASIADHHAPMSNFIARKVVQRFQRIQAPREIESLV